MVGRIATGEIDDGAAAQRSQSGKKVALQERLPSLPRQHSN
jgi:hypothetical protein